MYQPTYAMTVDHAQAALEDGLRAIATGQTHFDLSNVSSFDSSTVAVLLNWQRAAGKGVIDLRFNLPPNLMSLIAVYGVAELLNIDTAASSVPHVTPVH